MSGIGDSDDPLAEFEEAKDERSPDEASSSKNDAGPSLGVQLGKAIVVDLHFPEKMREKTEKEKKRSG